MISSTGAHFPIAGSPNTSPLPAGTIPRRGPANSLKQDRLPERRLLTISGLMMMYS